MPPPPGTDEWALLVALAAAAALGAWIAVRSRGTLRARLGRLRRDLRRGRGDPRAAAHALAALLRRSPGAAPLLPRLDALRFRREPPTTAGLLALVDEALARRRSGAGDG